MAAAVVTTALAEAQCFEQLDSPGANDHGAYHRFGDQC
jgi:hypothetical protein